MEVYQSIPMNNHYKDFHKQLFFFFFFKNLCFPDLFSILGIDSIVSICDYGHRPLDPEPCLSNQILKLQSKVRNIQKYNKSQVMN